MQDGRETCREKTVLGARNVLTDCLNCEIA